MRSRRTAGHKPEAQARGDRPPPLACASGLCHRADLEFYPPARQLWLLACVAVVALGLVPILTPLSSAGEPAPPPRGEELPPPKELSLPREEGPLSSGDLPAAPFVAPPLPAVPPVPAPPPVEAVLRPGQAMTLRIRQVLPADGLSPGERLLNSRHPILPGDHFLAEVVAPPCTPAALVGGTVTQVVAPGCFGRPGYVTLQLSQILQTVDGRVRLVPWQLDLADRRGATQVRRALLTVLFGLEGALIGASIGEQNPNLSAAPVAVAGAAGGGLLLGLGYASLQRGLEARLEPGDTFRIVVGTMRYQPVPRDLQTILYPAADPSKPKGKAK
jgi:hypothetical protein